MQLQLLRQPEEQLEKQLQALARMVNHLVLQ